MPSAAPTRARRVIDGQDFADIEAYGVERWLAELALALRQETTGRSQSDECLYRKANGKLRPLGISSVRDRVCMTAALLVLEPIFEADLPPEIYAYRAGRNAQQAVVEVEELCSVATRTSSTPTSRTTSGAFPCRPPKVGGASDR
jgi:Retron-type reverse transcriptase